MIYYKVLNHDGRPFHGGNGKWSLPDGDKPGDWMPPIDNIAICVRGYHVVNQDQLMSWLGPAIFEVEVKGASICDNNKSVFESARLIRKLDTWNDKAARLFAADCAQRVLPFFEAKLPNDHRPRKAIEAARQFANGKITAAAQAAAWDAARAAAWDAARDATQAAAQAAAWAAAWDAAWAAAWAAARAAAWDATQAAAWAAARAAAWDAEKIWQTEKLFEYLEGKIK